jgi:hypothetical protein
VHPGQTVVLKMPNARRDAAAAERPRLEVSGASARVIVLAHGGLVMADQVTAPRAALEIGRGAERIVVIGQGEPVGPLRDAGLAGWHAGMHLPYAGWSTAVAPGCVLRSSGQPLRAHRERLEAGWVTGAELARGVSTVTTRFSEPATTVVVVLDDPAAFGDPAGGRRLLLGLDGAERARDGAGRDRPPVLLNMENRSVLAYDVVPAGQGPVVVTVASELGWSLVGVMAGETLSAAGAIAVISARGLDAAIRPFAGGTSGASRLGWSGPTRTSEERRRARALASGRPIEVNERGKR